ncbi:MAG: class I SAM-dependent methyltransferase [Candidatus Binataceae bacterium]
MKFALKPNKLRLFYRQYCRDECTILDVGCGNRSASITKRWFPKCHYFGVDRVTYNNTPEDFALMERFFRVDLEADDLHDIPDGAFDIVIFSHVIEHLTNGLPVLANLTKKLKQGGAIYVEFPSLKSLSLPSAKGTLNFCDDDTHVRVYDIKDVSNTLLASGCSIVRAGRVRAPARVMILPAVLALKLYELVRHREITARGLWDVVGFADYVYGRRRGRATRVTDEC